MKKAEELTKDTESGLVELLRKKFPNDRYAVIPQVRNAAGHNASNTADALAIGLYPSRGLHLHGFEVKCSRADWLSELKQPHKAEAFQPYCDFWWLVTSPDVIKPGELPPDWGHYERKGKSLTCKVEAAQNANPLPFSRTMLAAMCKRQDSGDIKLANQARIEGYEKGRQAGLAEGQRESQKHVVDELRRQIDEFEKASGVAITAWNAGKIGDAVKRVLAGDGMQDKLRRQRKSLSALVSDFDRLIDE